MAQSVIPFKVVTGWRYIAIYAARKGVDFWYQTGLAQFYYLSAPMQAFFPRS